MYKVGFIGCGKLGLSCAEMIAEKYHVLGYDKADRQPANFSMVSSVEQVMHDRDIIFIAVETPHDPDYDGMYPTSHLPPKDFDYSVVATVLKEVNLYVKPNQTVVLISTVLPGICRTVLSPLLTNANLLYNPYLIAMGTVKWDMVNPEMIIIGRKNVKEQEHSNKLMHFYSTIMQNSPPMVSGTYEEAESVKVFYNTFISAKVALVNMIQDVAEKLGNMDAGYVCNSLANATRRIMGPAYMTPGMGDGGACHPRDNIALRYLAKNLNLGYDLFDSIMLAREVQAKNLAEFICEKNTDGLPVVIVGKAYKPLVPYTNGSSSILVGYYLEQARARVYFYDPQLNEYPPENLGPAVYLLAHDPEVTYGDQLDIVPKWYHGNRNVAEADHALDESYSNQNLAFHPGSIVVDPWRKIANLSGVTIFHYGNTRNR